MDPVDLVQKMASKVVPIGATVGTVTDLTQTDEQGSTKVEGQLVPMKGSLLEKGETAETSVIDGSNKEAGTKGKAESWESDDAKSRFFSFFVFYNVFRYP